MEAVIGSSFDALAADREAERVRLALAAALVPPRPCQIAFAGVDATEAPKVEVRAWLERLGALTAPMTGGRVFIDGFDEGRKPRQYLVRMELTMPGGVVVVGPDHPSNGAHEDVYVAIRNAFRAARRQLEIHAQIPIVATGIELGEPGVGGISGDAGVA